LSQLAICKLSFVWLNAVQISHLTWMTTTSSHLAHSVYPPHIWQHATFLYFLYIQGGKREHLAHMQPFIWEAEGKQESNYNQIWATSTEAENLISRYFSNYKRTSVLICQILTEDSSDRIFHSLLSFSTSPEAAWYWREPR